MHSVKHGKPIALSAILLMACYLLVEIVCRNYRTFREASDPILVTIAIPLFGSAIAFLGLIPFYLKEKGYNWWAGTIVATLSLATMIKVIPTGLFLAPLTVLIVAYLGFRRKMNTLGLFVSFLLLGGLMLLDHHGYRIYGYSHFYRSPPPKNENWIPVKDFVDRQHIELADGTILSLHPYGFTEKAFALGENYLSWIVFNVSESDLYFKEESPGKWIVRTGTHYNDRGPCRPIQCFFPRRYYDYENIDVPSYGFQSIVSPTESAMEIVDMEAFMEEVRLHRQKLGLED